MVTTSLPTTNTTVARSLAEWLRNSPWTHVCTLTFNKEITESVAVARFHRWIRMLERANQGYVDWLYVVESTYAGRPHIHVLLGNTTHLSNEYISQKWGYRLNGRSRVEAYNPKLGAAYYVTKHAGTAEAWDYSVKSLTQRKETYGHN